MAVTTKSEKTSEEVTSLDLLGHIFSKEFVSKNQSRFTVEGKVDFSKLKDFLLKQGYSDKFVNEVSEKLRKGEITLKNALTFSRAAKNDLDLRNQAGVKAEVGPTGLAIKQEFQQKFYTNRGKITLDDMKQQAIVNTLEYHNISEETRKKLKQVWDGKLSVKDFSDYVQKLTIEEKNTLRLLLEKDNALAAIFKRDGWNAKPENIDKICLAKDEPELKNIAIELGLFTPFTWDRMINEIEDMFTPRMEPGEIQFIQFVTTILREINKRTKEEIQSEEWNPRYGNAVDLKKFKDEELKMKKGIEDYIKKAGDAGSDVNMLIGKLITENVKRTNEIIGNAGVEESQKIMEQTVTGWFQRLAERDGQLTKEELRVLETLTGKRPPVNYNELSYSTRATLLEAIRNGLRGLSSI